MTSIACAQRGLVLLLTSTLSIQHWQFPFNLEYVFVLRDGLLMKSVVSFLSFKVLKALFQKRIFFDAQDVSLEA